MTMSEKFPSVRILSSLFGVDEGTELVFDFYSGKYVSVEEEEDISENGYYYSGFAFAIDPYLVKRNIGELFAYVNNELENDEEKEGIEVGTGTESGSDSGEDKGSTEGSNDV